MKKYACAFAKQRNVYWLSATRTESKYACFYSIINHTDKLLVEVSWPLCSGPSHRPIIRPQHKNSRNSVLYFYYLSYVILLWRHAFENCNHVTNYNITGSNKQTQTVSYNLMFFWPCIMNWLYINYQLDAGLFFIHKILFSSTCFEHQLLTFRRT